MVVYLPYDRVANVHFLGHTEWLLLAHFGRRELAGWSFRAYRAFAEVEILEPLVPPTWDAPRSDQTARRAAMGIVQRHIH